MAQVLGFLPPLWKTRHAVPDSWLWPDPALIVAFRRLENEPVNESILFLCLFSLSVTLPFKKHKYLNNQKGSISACFIFLFKFALIFFCFG